MATAHQLSVITNSCIKSPVTVRQTNNNKAEQLQYASDQFDTENIDPSHQTTESRTMPAGFAANLDELSDEDFYKRLVELRNEHKKTLDLCERLYNEKLGYLSNPTSPGSWGKLSQEHEPAFKPNRSADDFMVKTGGFGVQNTSGSSASDKIRDMSAVTGKPPSGRPYKRLDASAMSDGAYDASFFSDNVEQDFWHHDSFRSSLSDIDNLTKPKERNYSAIHNNTKAMAMSKIEDMFTDFTVDEYAPRTRQRSNSTSALAPKKSEEKEWRHRITIPQPFNMTVREETKPKKKSTVAEELKKQREEKLKLEEAECQKVFKARPVPANVYLPLFEEIMEKKEARRRDIKENRTQLLQSMQKPFKFSLREEKLRSERHACLDNDYIIRPSSSKQFKANPYPDHIFDNQVNDKILEEEEYRRIRMQMRSEELLRSASLPPNMEARGKEYVEAKSRQKARIEKLQQSVIEDYAFRPQISHEVPNFSEVHKRFLKEVEGKRQPKEATTCQPFTLRTEERGMRASSARDVRGDSREANGNSSRRNSQDFTKSLGSISSSFDTTIPAKMTASVELKAQARRKKEEAVQQARRMREDEEKVRRLKEQEMRKVVAEKAAAFDRSSLNRKDFDSKTQELRKQTVEKTRSYKKGLKDINSKLADRPFLFEQVAQANARKRMEKKYKDTLRDCGLNEEHVHRMGSGAASSDMSPDRLRTPSPRTFDDTTGNGYHRTTESPAEYKREQLYSDDFETGSNDSRRQSRERIDSAGSNNARNEVSDEESDYEKA